MTDNVPLVLILEDYPTQRISYEQTLRRRGFHVRSAGTVDDGLALAQELAGRVDVAVLDMRMDRDSEANSRTGVDVGRALVARRDLPAPLFLFYTAYEECNYYSAAVELGAAAYLKKTNSDNTDLMRHVRVLAVNSLLTSRRYAHTWPEHELGRRYTSYFEAVVHACGDYLAPTLVHWLGVECCLVIMEGDRVVPVVEGLAPQRSGIGDWRSLLTIVQSSTTGCYVSGLEARQDRATDHVDTLFPGTATWSAIELASVGDLRVLAIFGRSPGSDRPEIISSRAEHIGPLALRYLRSAVETRLIALRDLVQGHQEEVFRSREQLRMISGFTSAIAQRLTNSLSSLSPTAPQVEPLPDLKRLCAELYTMGNVLAGAASDSGAGRADLAHAFEEVLAEPFLRPGSVQLDQELPADLRVGLSPDALARVLRTLLVWLCGRASPDLGRPAVQASVLRLHPRHDPAVEIRLLDRSPLLPEDLRERLFEPYAQPVLYPLEDGSYESGILDLFLARFLVHGAGGQLLAEPRGDGAEGHQIRLILPADAASSAPAPSS